MNTQRTWRRSDTGLTLIELLLVVAIMSVLIAIMVPTFIGARTSAEDRSAVASLRIAALTGFSEAYGAEAPDTFNGTVGFITAQMPELTIVGYNAASTGPKTVSLWGGRAYAAGNGFWVSAAARASENGKCWAVFVPSEGANTGRFIWASTTNVTCSAEATLAGIPTADWGDL